MSSSAPRRVLVTDFDGTMTQHDFYALVAERLLPANTPDYFAEYRAGRLTHFEALARYFAAIRHSRDEVLAVVDSMGLDPGIREAVAALRQADWEVVVASAGCSWYIEHLLRNCGLTLQVHANPGEFVEGEGVKMQLPTGSAFLSPTHGIDKAAIVRHYLEQQAIVAFAGDGFPDEPAARLVADHRRFARGNLAAVLADAGLRFQQFASWSDMTRQLLAGEHRPT